MGFENAARKTTPEEAFHVEPTPKPDKPKLRLVPPEGLRRPGGAPAPKQEKQALVPVPENVVLGAEYQPSDVIRNQETVDIEAMLAEDQKKMTEAWEAQRKKDEEIKDNLEARIANSQENDPDLLTGETKTIEDLPPKPKVEAKPYTGEMKPIGAEELTPEDVIGEGFDKAA